MAKPLTPQTQPASERKSGRGSRAHRRIEGISDLSHQRAQAPRTADLIFRALHDDIVAMRLRPNDRLSEHDLIARFGVSRTPLREAILRLADEGLVVIFPQAGTFVARIPVRRLCETILIRRTLEGLLVETACRTRTEADLAALDLNLREMEALCARDDMAGFHRNDQEFHALIGQIADLPTVVATAEHIRTQIDRYRVMTLPQSGRMARVLAEHRAVRDAILARDGKAAAQAMGHHLGQLLDEIAAREEMDPDYFHDDRKRSCVPT